VDSNRAVTLRGTSSADKSISFATQARLVTKGGTRTSHAFWWPCLLMNAFRNSDKYRRQNLGHQGCRRGLDLC
jgi:hypothetical protein